MKSNAMFSSLFNLMFEAQCLKTKSDDKRLFNIDDDEEEGGEEKMPSCGDYVLHFLTVFWKILFAFVPPTGKMMTVKLS